MSGPAPLHTSSQVSAFLAEFTKPRSQAPHIVGAITYRSTLERGERLGAGSFVRAWRRVLLLASRWFHERLYRFNAKFQPTWVPRFVVYAATRDLPRIAMAALEAEAFLTWPRLHRFSGSRA